jgi:hypothetical protein
MTQKPFGVKQLNVIGAAGTPTIESAGDLNIGGQQVAITTNTSIAGVITATSDITIDNGINQTALLTNNSTLKSDPELTLYTNSTSQFRGSRVELLNSSNGTQLVHLNDNPSSKQYFAIEKTDNTGVFQQQMAIYSYANDEWVFKTGSAEVESLTIKNGQVGIGTTVIDSTLTVAGVVSATTYYGDGSNLTGISGGGGIALTDLSVSTASAGTAALSYNNSNGVFSYTPPDLSGFAANTNVSNWDTAYGWGNHASAGYLTSVNQNFSGIVTATSFQGNSTTGDGSDRGFTTKYYITASGSSAYRFAGPGVLNSTNNPTLYFHRGFTYILENSTGSGHPFALRVSSGGSNYAPGGSFLTGSQNGTQILTVPFDGPSSIVYQCTLHGGMLGTINFVS